MLALLTARGDRGTLVKDTALSSSRKLLFCFSRHARGDRGISVRDVAQSTFRLLVCCFVSHVAIAKKLRQGHSAVFFSAALSIHARDAFSSCADCLLGQHHREKRRKKRKFNCITFLSNVC